jgi:hypothetical protein
MLVTLRRSRTRWQLFNNLGLSLSKHRIERLHPSGALDALDQNSIEGPALGAGPVAKLPVILSRSRLAGNPVDLGPREVRPLGRRGIGGAVAVGSCQRGRDSKGGRIAYHLWLERQLNGDRRASSERARQRQPSPQRLDTVD